MPERLTVIIPTRERHDTLQWALKTCVEQDFDQLEILVSDNASTDETRDVVDSYDDSRIRYINPGLRLGMSEHWEFALSHVSDGYAMFLGDDDGLMPHAAAEMSEILEAEATEAMIWAPAMYYWPEYFDHSIANCLSIPFPQHHSVSWLNSSQVLERVGGFRAPHYLLPSPYWGAVHRSVFDRIAMRSGRIFHSIIPDLYSGVAVAAVTTSYLRSASVYSLAGASQHSNGASQLSGYDEDEGETSKHAVFASENGLPFHAELDLARNYCVLIAESFLQARDHVSVTVPKPELGAMYRAVLTHPDHLFNPRVGASTVAALRATAMRSGTTDVLESELRRNARTHLASRAWAAAKILCMGNSLVDCTPDNVTNIYQATLTANRMLRADPTTWSSAAQRVKGRVTKASRALRFARSRLVSSPPP